MHLLKRKMTAWPKFSPFPYTCQFLNMPNFQKGVLITEGLPISTRRRYVGPSRLLGTPDYVQAPCLFHKRNLCS